MRILEEKKLFPTEKHGFAISVLKNQNVEDVHGHEFNELVIVNGGSGFHIYNEKVMFINRGDFFYINSCDVHSYESTNNLSLINILFRKDLKFLFIQNVSKILELMFGKSLQPNHKNYIDDDDLSLINTKIDCINAMRHATPDDFYFMKTEACIFQILEILCRNKNKTYADKFPEERRKIILRHIRENFHQEINWSTLCAENKINRRTLFRDIKEITGVSPEKFHQRYKLLKAKELLRTSDKKISEIAQICGFKNTTRFSEAYKREYHIVPSYERTKLT